MEKLICTIFVDRDEFGNLDLVIRDSCDLEHRNPLSCSLDDLDSDRIYYALLHDCVI